jgi:lipoate-protein ligase A
LRENAKRELLKQAATLETLIGSVISWDEAAEAFMNGFQEVLRNSLTPLELTSEEEATAEQLMKTRYRVSLLITSKELRAFPTGW